MRVGGGTLPACPDFVPIRHVTSDCRRSAYITPRFAPIVSFIEEKPVSQSGGQIVCRATRPDAKLPALLPVKGLMRAA
jgi:hypothetical protein